MFDANTGAKFAHDGAGCAAKLRRIEASADSTGFLATYEAEDRSQSEVIDLVRLSGASRVTSIDAQQFVSLEAHSPSGTTFLAPWQGSTEETRLVDATTRKSLRVWLDWLRTSANLATSACGTSSESPLLSQITCIPQPHGGCVQSSSKDAI